MPKRTADLRLRMESPARPFLLIVLLLVLVAHATPAHAGPVFPMPVTITQPDGTTFGARPFGDEWYNGYETLAGYTILLDETTGVWHYAEPGSDGNLVAGRRQPGRDAPMGLPAHLRPARAKDGARLGFSAISQDAAAGHQGTEHVLVLLVSFSDRGPVGTTPAYWASQAFGSSGSLRSYYEEVSYGKLNLAPAQETHGTPNDGVVGWLNLGYPHPNTAGEVGQANRQIVYDAIVQADPYVDFARFDTNGDKYISLNELHLIVVVAGYETSYGGPWYTCAPSIWAHRWALGFAHDGYVPAPRVDGVNVGQGPAGGYSQFGEWHCAFWDSPGHAAPIGPMVHEIGHDLGWPDLYDIDYSSEGVGYWSVMGAGNWLRTTGPPGSLPAHPDAFLKWYQGWLIPTRAINTVSNFAIPQIETAPFALQLLENPGGVNWVYGAHSGIGEYFLVENRQRVGFDAGLPGCGLLIWHIDETRPSDNSANQTDERRLVDLEEADGQNHLDRNLNPGDAGDPYPGTSNNRAFNATSTPNNRLYNGLPAGFNLQIVSQACAGEMSVNVVFSGEIDTPTPTRTRTPSPSATSSRTPSRTATATHTSTWTATPTASSSATPTSTWTHTPTSTATASPTLTATVTPSATDAFTATPTSSATRTSTVTSSPTATVTPTFTPTPSATPTATPTSSATWTRSPTPSPTATDTATATATPTATHTPSPTVTDTATPAGAHYTVFLPTILK